MADVTVLGVGGTTVTIPVTATDVAKAMQSALANVSNAVTGSVLTQVNYTGNSTLPAVSTAEGGVIATAAGASTLAAFGISAPFVSGVLGGAAVQQVVVGFGTSNTTVASGAGGSTISSGTTVTGAGGAEIANLGTNTQVFLGGAAVQNFAELGLGIFGGAVNPSATVWVTTPLAGTVNFDDSSGDTTINLDTVQSTLSVAHPFGQKLILNNNGNGNTTINVASATVTGGNPVDGDALSFRGTSTVATTVNAAGDSVAGTGGVEMWALMKSGNAFINGGDSEVILFPTGAGVSATLFGGSGTDIDVGAPGFIKGGTAGNNILFGGTTAGSTTLFGGGSGDVLVQQSAGNTFLTGAGSENLFAFVSGDLYGEGVSNTVSGSGANTATINSFVSGVDSISLINPAGGGYTTVTGSTPTSSEIAVAISGSNTTVKFGDGTTWTVIGAHVQGSDFVA